MNRTVRVRIPQGVYLPGQLYDLIEDQISSAVYDEYGRSKLSELTSANVENILNKFIDKGFLDIKSCAYWTISDLVPECTDNFYISEATVPELFTTLHNGSRTWNINAVRKQLRIDKGADRLDAMYQTDVWVKEHELRRVSPATYIFAENTAPYLFGKTYALHIELIGEKPLSEGKTYMASLSWMSGGGGKSRGRGKYSFQRLIKVYAILDMSWSESQKRETMRTLLEDVVYNKLNYPTIREIQSWRLPDESVVPKGRSRANILELLQEPDYVNPHGYWEYIVLSGDGATFATSEFFTESSGMIEDVEDITGIKNPVEPEREGIYYLGYELVEEYDSDKKKMFLVPIPIPETAMFKVDEEGK